MPHPIVYSVDSTARAYLPDGSRYLIRPIVPGDRALVGRCFERMSPESRRQRFFAAKQVLAARELEHLSTPDDLDHIALIAVRLDRCGIESEAVGAARCLRLSGEPDAAEMSIAVLDEVQGLGLGTTLLRMLGERAVARGIKRFRSLTLTENTRMRALTERLGGQVHWLGDGALELDWQLPPIAAAPEPTWPYDPRPVLDAWFDLWTLPFNQATNGAALMFDTMLSAWPGNARAAA